MNLKGGYKILLLPILSLVEVATAITDEKVIEQLSTLIGYMGKKELKPMLIHCRIEKDSKVTKHCVMGELKKISDTEYVIIGKIDKSYLTISVEFTQDEETEEYYIASGDATYILSETTKVGDLVVDGDVDITGDVGIDGDVDITGDVGIDGGITSKGIANTGNIGNIGNIATTGQVSGSEILEIMASGYNFVPSTKANITITPIYSGIVKTGNKITAVWFGKCTRTGDVDSNLANIGTFQVPSAIAEKLIPTPIGTVTTALSSKLIPFFKSANSSVSCNVICRKGTNSFDCIVYNLNTLDLDTEYQYRVEITFLLSTNLIPQE